MSIAAHATALAAVEQTLDAAHPGWATDPAVAAAARALSVHYTEGRAPAQTLGLDDTMRAMATLAYFAPRTLAAIAWIQTQLGVSSVPETVLDVGAGTGAGALFFAAAGAQRVTLWERDAAALRLATTVFQALPRAVRIDQHVVNLPGKAPKLPDERLALFAFSLSELAQRFADEDALFAWVVADVGAPVLIVEPGDREAARRVQRLRAYALSQGRSIRAPCLHIESCPALSRARDWCHHQAARGLTARFVDVAEAVGRDTENLAVSFLYIDKVAATKAEENPPLLVIGEPQSEKGRVRLPVCGPGGTRYVQALNRHRETARALKRIPRGERLYARDGRFSDDTVHIVELPTRVDSANDA